MEMFIIKLQNRIITLKSKTRKQLLEVCLEKGYSGYKYLNKEELIDFITKCESSHNEYGDPFSFPS